MATVRHEGFHQYFDRLVGDSPVWLNEGMAEYYENAGIVGGRWKDDQVNIEHLALLQQLRGRWTRLKAFVEGDNRSFRARSSLHYAQAWAFVHFLKNGGREPQKVLDRLLDELKEGSSNADAISRAFADVDWEEFEREFTSYVGDLDD